MMIRGGRSNLGKVGTGRIFQSPPVPLVVLRRPPVALIPVHVEAQSRKLIQLLGHGGVARPQQVAHALHQQSHPARHVILPPGRIPQRALAPADGQRDVVHVQSYVPDIVLQPQHRIVRGVLLLRQLVLLGSQSRDLLAQRVAHPEDPVGQRRHGALEVPSRDGHHLLQIFGEEVGKEEVGRPARSGADGDLDERSRPSSPSLGIGMGMDDDRRRSLLRRRLIRVRIQQRRLPQQRRTGQSVGVGTRGETEGERGDLLGGVGHAVVAGEDDEGSESEEEPLAEGRGEGTLG
mmetsp:Transcript_16686/g.28704  ORF Transcript_16686/g.28704 Transcript_16686/m.28704 type:complete len:291 (+) Transcript_16686:412-1284(+)